MFDLYSNLSAPKAGGAANASAATTPTEAKPATSGWSSTASKFSGGEKSANVPSVLAQNVLLKRKRLQQPQPPKVARSPMSVANAKIKEEITTPHLQPSSNLGGSDAHGRSLSSGIDEPHHQHMSSSRMGGSRLGPMDADEYDPARPNDYEEYVNERQARAQRRELERQQREQEREAQREQQRGFQQSVPMDEDDYREPSRGSSHHHRYSPPPQPSRRDSSPPPASAASAASGKLDLNVSGEEAWRRRAQLSAGASTPAAPPASTMTAHDPYGYDSEETPTRTPQAQRVSNHIPPPLSFDSPAPTPTPVRSAGGGGGGNGGAGLSVAEQMMKKMGWTEGRGLGREGQGILNPLEHKKLKGKGPASGVIIDVNSKAGIQSHRRKVESSKVILLRNMVGPGEVDEDLESETAEECTKFGPVVRCKIYEEKNPMVPSDKSVRIFVQFTTLDSALKAINSLHGRFFAKRQVEAIFFDEERWEHGDLASHPDEY